MGSSQGVAIVARVSETELMKTIARTAVSLACVACAAPLFAQTANTQTTYAYDAKDHVTQVTDPSGLSTTYAYDGLSNPTSTTSPDSGVTASTYDAAGDVLTGTDAKGNAVTYTYDAGNRRLTGTYASDSTLNVTYKWDEPNTTTGCAVSFPVNHMTRVIQTAVTTVFCYNAQGFVTQMSQSVNGSTDVTSYSRSAAGRILAITHPSGDVLTYGHDAVGRVNAITATTNSGSMTLVSGVTYEPFGPVSGYTLGNNQTVTRTYDANYRLSDLVSPAFTVHLARDANGNVTAIGNTPGANPATESYAFDPLNRLTTITEPGGTVSESVTYNQAGDRLSKSGSGLATGAYTYNPGTHQLNATGNAARTVDADGNTTAFYQAGSIYGFAFNASNRMSLAQMNQITVATYLYNDDGDRVAKTVGATTERYNYDPDEQLISEYGVTNREYVWLGNIPVANLDIQGTTTTVAYVTADELGTPRAVSDATGNIVWAWPRGQNAWGEQQPISNGYTYNLRFPGQYYDAETGLHNNVNRDYDNSIGGYTETDPTGQAGGIGLYHYAANNPLSFVDPMGLQAQPSPAPPASPGLPPAPNTGPVPNGTPPANDPEIDPEAPGTGGLVAACASNPVVCGAIMMVVPRDAGGPEDETHPNVIPFPKSKAPSNTCPGEGSPQEDHCQALKQSILNTCRGLKGKAQIRCFAAANTAYRQCMGFE